MLQKSGFRWMDEEITYRESAKSAKVCVLGK
jgi:hypothetical protein